MSSCKPINGRELNRQYELEPRQCVTDLMEGLEDGTLSPEELSLRDMFVAFYPGGWSRGQQALYEMSFRRGRGNHVALQEAANAVVTGDFANITGQIIYNRVREAYNDPVLLWPELCTTQMTEFLNGERIPGIGRIGDLSEKIEENAPYPIVGLNEEWTDTNPTIKHGFELDVTREAIIADRTGVLLKWAAEGGRWAGVTKEKEVMGTATGQQNSYNRNGVSTNTYLTSGAYINSQTGNALDGQANEWRALEKADLLFDAMTDPNTGEPIGIPNDPQILVPSALVRTANRIIGATEVQTVDMRANATTIRTTGKNPYGDRQPKVLSNQYVKQQTSSTSQWFYGDFKRAILYMSVWEIETTQAANNNEVEFTRDVWARYKVSYRGRVQMYEPRFLTKNDT